MDETQSTLDGSEELEGNEGTLANEALEGGSEGLHLDESRAWINDLPEDLRGATNFNKFTATDEGDFIKVPKAMAYSYKDLEGQLGQDRLKVPETDEAKAEFYEKLGWDKDYEKYSEGIKRREMPEGVEYDTAQEEFLLQMAHSSHVPLSEVQKRYDEYVDTRLKAIEDETAAQQQYLDHVQETNQREFGTDIDVIKNRAQVAMSEFNSPEFIHMLETKEVDGMKLGDHPQMLGFMAKLGKDRMGIGDAEKGQTSTETQEDIQAQIDDVMNDADYWDEHSTRYKSLQMKADRLFKRQAGEI
jgi:hypothetical protein